MIIIHQKNDDDAMKLISPAKIVSSRNTVGNNQNYHNQSARDDGRNDFLKSSSVCDGLKLQLIKKYIRPGGKESTEVQIRVFPFLSLILCEEILVH
jgi:hypothetical protein